MLESEASIPTHKEVRGELEIIVGFKLLNPSQISKRTGSSLFI